MSKRIFTGFLVLVAVVALAGSGFAFGFSYGKKVPQTLLVRGAANIEGKSDADFSTYWQAWSEINDSFLNNSKITNEEKLQGSIAGLVHSLKDPYSEYFNPADAKKFQEDVQGNFGGIGAEIGIRKNQLIVIAPLKESPSEKAGLLAGDNILKINATSTDGLTVEEAVNFIRGPKGTSVTLTLFREGWEKPKDISITRDTIVVPTLDLTMHGNIAHVALHGFNAVAVGLFRNAVREATLKGMKGIVLDLRNNPGGYLDVAVDLAGWFLKPDTLVVSEEGREGIMETLKSAGTGSLSNLPLVILINQGSASASEILAGALRDQRKIKLIGEKSFGKGTVQELRDLRDGSSMKITVAHWVLPSGTILENGGLPADIEVKMTEKDIEDKKDPQLDKALEILKPQIPLET